MKDLKLVELLKTFDKTEFRKFREFVSSPYFNKNENVINLLEALLPYYPGFDNRNFTLEKIFSKIFLNKKFNYAKITNIISDLYALSERFIEQVNMEGGSIPGRMALLTGLRQKGLSRIYEHKFDRRMKELESAKVKDENYFYYMYEMYDDYLWYATVVKPNKELNLLQKEFDNFFYYSLVRLIRFYSLMLHERNQSNIEYNLIMFDEILMLIKKGGLINNPTLMVFSAILQLLHTKDLKYYNELKLMKIKYYNELRRDDQYILFVHLYDFCAYMVNFKGDDSYNRDMLEIYKEMMEKQFMTRDNFLYFNFMNVVKVACRVEEFEYAESFIKEYKGSIPEEEKENVLSFCFGIIENSRGNLEKALKHFSKANFQNFIIKVQVKILLLKLYYKLGMYEQAFGMVDTFRHYIAREENLLSEHRESYNKFLTLMAELIKIKEAHPQDMGFELKKIKKAAEKMPANPFRIRTWLLDELAGV